ncbi:MAG: Crp/Fnr family transcriptional regulator [Enterococcus gilvus]
MVCFDYGLVQQLMLEEPLLTHVYIGILEETLRIKLVRETALLTESATERYLKLKAEIPTIDQRVNHTHIASYIGVTPVSLSRIRRTLREEN